MYKKVVNKKQSLTQKGGMFGNPFISYVDKEGELQFITYAAALNGGIQNYGIIKPDSSYKVLPESIEVVDDSISKFRNELIPISLTSLELYTLEEINNINTIMKNVITNSTGVIKGGRLHKACLKKCGGGLLEQKSLFADIINYCQRIQAEGIDDNKDIEKYLKYNHDNILKDENFTALAKYINDNQTPKTKMLYINCNNFYKYTNCEPYYDHTKVLKIKYDCFDYNEDIVSSFESSNFEGVNYEILSDEEIQHNQENNIYSNNAAINKFIKAQLNYLDSLPLYQKRIIQDYTRINTTFHFYELFKNKNKHYDTFRWFSDGFFTQIYKLYNHDHDADLNHYYYSSLNIKKFSENWFKHWLKHDRVEDNRDKVYGNAPIVYKHARPTPFIGALFINWDDVLTTFIDDVTYIILEAPEVEDTIYGYRGVSSHYIHENQSQTEKSNHIAEIKRLIDQYTPPASITSTEKRIVNKKLTQVLEADNFLNFRLSSITFDFKISKFFHDKFINKNSAIYKSAIKKGCKVLLISPLSMFYQEFEIITPPYSITMYIDESHEDGSINHSTSNNIDTKYGICIKKEFKTYHNILTKTPMTYAEYLNMPAIINTQTETHKQHTAEVTSRGLTTAVSNLLKKRGKDVVDKDKVDNLLKSESNIKSIKPIVITHIVPRVSEYEAMIENANILQTLSMDEEFYPVITDPNVGDRQHKLREIITKENAYLDELNRRNHEREIENLKRENTISPKDENTSTNFFASAIDTFVHSSKAVGWTMEAHLRNTNAQISSLINSAYVSKFSQGEGEGEGEGVGVTLDGT